MKDNIHWVYNRSSLLTSLPVLGVLLVLCAVCMAVRLRGAAAALLIVFVLAGISRLWAVLALRRVSLTVSGGTDGVFPGQKLEFQLCIHNGKLLPLVWLELFFPLAENLCLTPEKTREPDQWELATLEELGCSQKKVGERRLPFCAWYETVELTSHWTANCRGIYSTAGWAVRSGDGFGLTQAEMRLSPESARTYAVYPALVPVSVQLFLRNLWNADTGTRGVMEDNTVIRSTRDYLPQDSLKHINWRLAARGLPLAVNVYEDILPRSVWFLVDGESFGGEEPHWDELEETLSVLASVLVGLEQNQVTCGLSLCRGSEHAVSLPVGAPTNTLLRALAAYQPAPPLKEANGEKIIRRPAEFDLEPIRRAVGSVGRFYALSYDCAALRPLQVLQLLDSSQLTLLTWSEEKPLGDYETISLRTLRTGKAT